MAEREIEKMPPRAERYAAGMAQAVRRVHSRSVAAGGVRMECPRRAAERGMG